MNPALLEASLAPDEKGNASRYHFRESEGASRLVIEGGADRTPVSIIHEGVRFRVVALEQDGTYYHGSTATGLFDYYKLSRLVAQGLMSRWQGAPVRSVACLAKLGQEVYTRDFLRKGMSPIPFLTRCVSGLKPKPPGPSGGGFTRGTRIALLRLRRLLL